MLFHVGNQSYIPSLSNGYKNVHRYGYLQIILLAVMIEIGTSFSLFMMMMRINDDGIWNNKKWSLFQLELRVK